LLSGKSVFSLGIEELLSLLEAYIVLDIVPLIFVVGVIGIGVSRDLRFFVLVFRVFPT
jgi:hypothetical protein